MAALGGSTLGAGEEAAFASVVETVAQVQPCLGMNAFVIKHSKAASFIAPAQATKTMIFDLR